jgi:ATP-dependent Lhr-like helicase
VRNADDLGALDPAAIERVREEAWPIASTPDEMYDALMVAGYIEDPSSSAIGPTCCSNSARAL